MKNYLTKKEATAILNNYMKSNGISGDITFLKEDKIIYDEDVEFPGLGDGGGKLKVISVSKCAIAIMSAIHKPIAETILGCNDIHSDIVRYLLLDLSTATPNKTLSEILKACDSTFYDLIKSASVDKLCSNYPDDTIYRKIVEYYLKGKVNKKSMGSKFKISTSNGF